MQVVMTARAPATAPTMSFRELLSDLNPLQYIPVVGAIYRRVTGDTIPEAVRAFGSMVVSGLTGGPLGVAVSAGLLALEKLTGIDPEAIEQDVLRGLGIGPDSAKTTPPAAPSPGAPPPATPQGGATRTVAAQTTPEPQAAQTRPAHTEPAQSQATETQANEAQPAKPWSAAQLAAYGVTRGPNGTLRHGALVGADVLNDLELARLGVVRGTTAPATPAPS